MRVSLKATSPEEFSRLTGATPEAFDLQLEALKNLLNAEVSFHPAIITMSFSSPEGIQNLKNKFQAIDQSRVGSLEEECVILYPPVVKRLKNAGIKPYLNYLNQKYSKLYCMHLYKASC